MFIVNSWYKLYIIAMMRAVVQLSLTWFAGVQTAQDSSKGGAVETGCSGLHYIIGCLII